MSIAAEEITGLSKAALLYLLVYGPGIQVGPRWTIILLYLALAVVTGGHLAAGLGGSIQDGVLTCLLQRLNRRPGSAELLTEMPVFGSETNVSSPTLSMQR